MYYITDNGIIENEPIDNFETSVTYENAIEILKRRRETIIINAYQNEVDGRFSSNTTGSTKWYDSKELDRNNLVGVVTSGKDSHYKCFTSKEDQSGQWVFHTIDQLKTILNDGRLLMIQFIQKRDTLISQIRNAETVEQIININW